MKCYSESPVHATEFLTLDAFDQCVVANLGEDDFADRRGQLQSLALMQCATRCQQDRVLSHVHLQREVSLQDCRIQTISQCGGAVCLCLVLIQKGKEIFFFGVGKNIWASR